MAKKIIFISGGARSGKSDFALKITKQLKGEVIYLATAQSLDREMSQRIKRHKLVRPSSWKTIEEPKKLIEVIEKNRKFPGTIIIDCITLWLNNIIPEKNDETVLKEVEILLRVVRKAKATFIIVSNEVGLGIVPPSRLGRRFRDLAGRVNQIIAKEADEFYFIISGVKMRLK